MEYIKGEIEKLYKINPNIHIGMSQHAEASKVKKYNKTKKEAHNAPVFLGVICVSFFVFSGLIYPCWRENQSPLRYLKSVIRGRGNPMCARRNST